MFLRELALAERIVNLLWFICFSIPLIDSGETEGSDSEVEGGKVESLVLHPGNWCSFGYWGTAAL